ncbi:MAG: lipoprotein-releasing ABC transporter permease subunit [Proteobacteria bacterium]|nr:lipoprotein-releasing ABC transporter permease subunit [Pseudomonadota bacterium]
MNFVSTIALRYQKKRRGFVSVVSMFSVIGITLGVAALIIVMSVMGGFRQELLNTVLGTTGHATVQQFGFTDEKSESINKKILEIPTVVSSNAFVSGQGMVVAHRQASGVMIKGVDEEKQKEIITFLENGQSETLKDHQIFVGNELAKKLGIKVGDSINLISPDGTQTIAGFIPRIKRLQVAGIFKLGMYQYDSAFVYTNINAAQSFFKMGERITGIEIKVEDPMTIDEVKTDIQIKLQDLSPKLPLANVTTWKQTNAEFFKALEIEKRTMFIILMLIIVVATFNIITGQMMLVNEKTKDIAILRSMGANSGQMQRIFFYSGLLLGLIGTIIGAVFGSLIVINLTDIVHFIENLFNTTLFSGQVYFLDEIPAILSVSDIIAVVFTSIILTVISSWIPSRKASKLDPVETLRNE